MDITIFKNELVKLFKEAIEEDPEWFKKVVGEVIKPVEKRRLTTQEMCYQLNINYRTWQKEGMNNHPDVIPLRDSNENRSYLYPVENLQRIKEIWRNRKK